MDGLVVKRLKHSPRQVKDVPSLLSAADVAPQAISVVNWKAYPYKPAVQFKIAHDEQHIYLSFEVDEQEIKAVCNTDGGSVWEDSCVEFFVAFDDNAYYNIECNCIGTVLMAYGPDRTARTPLPQAVLNNIQRFSSLGSNPMQGKGKWTLALIIPKEVFMHHQIETFSALHATGNFYKCGDLLQVPHFLSWNPIDNPTPNFHLPAYFGRLHFEG